MHVNRETSIICVKDMASQPIKERQQVVLLDSHHGRISKHLVGHTAEMYGKWLMAACYFYLWINYGCPGYTVHIPPRARGHISDCGWSVTCSIRCVVTGGLLTFSDLKRVGVIGS